MTLFTDLRHSIIVLRGATDVCGAISAFSWAQLAQIAYLVATIAPVSVYRYYRDGPRLPNWDLAIQLMVDLASSLFKLLTPFQLDDEGIEDTDFLKIVLPIRKCIMSKTSWPKGKGVHRKHYINTQAVGIDANKLADIEVVGAKLARLVHADMAVEDPRMLPCEIILGTTAISALESHITDKDCLLDIAPIVDSEKIVLFFHGGGWILGGIDSHRHLTGNISQASGTRVISVDYRLSPEHVFPAHLHDAYVSYCFLLKQGFKAENVIVAGDSAGGQLALSLTHLLRSINSQTPAGLVLLSPATNQRHIKYDHDARHVLDYLVFMPVEVSGSMARLMIAPGLPLTGQVKRELESPFVSPIYGNFDGFPPTLIQTGGCESLLDGNIELYEKLKSQNPDKPDIAQQDIYADMPHDIHLILGYRPETAKSYAVIGEFISSL